MAMDLDAAVDEVVASIADNSDLEPETPDDDPELAEDGDGPDLEDDDLEDEDDGELPEGDEELDGDESDEDEDGETPEGIELAEDDTIVLPNGDVVTVKEAALRHADYTRKTQELAEQRREFETEREQWSAEREELEDVRTRMREWLEDRTSNPADWAREVVADSPNPTQTIAKAIVALNNEGRLDPDFVEQFKLEAPDSVVAARADKAQDDDRLTRIEQQLEEQRQAEQEISQRRERVKQMFDEWDQLKLSQGLTFESEAAEHEARRETLKFAIENGLVDRLGIAHDALTARGSKSSTTSGTKPVPAKKKRATRAMAQKSSGSSRKAAPKKAKTVEGAAELAIDEYLAG